MNQAKKEDFINKFVWAVQGAILDKVKRMPEDWDGIEIMWLFREYCIQRCTRFRPTDYRKRYKKFKVEKETV